MSRSSDNSKDGQDGVSGESGGLRGGDGSGVRQDEDVFEMSDDGLVDEDVLLVGLDGGGALGSDEEEKRLEREGRRGGGAGSGEGEAGAVEEDKRPGPPNPSRAVHKNGTSWVHLDESDLHLLEKGDEGEWRDGDAVVGPGAVVEVVDVVNLAAIALAESDASAVDLLGLDDGSEALGFVDEEFEGTGLLPFSMSSVQIRLALLLPVLLPAAEHQDGRHSLLPHHRPPIPKARLRGCHGQDPRPIRLGSRRYRSHPVGVDEVGARRPRRPLLAQHYSRRVPAAHLLVALLQGRRSSLRLHRLHQLRPPQLRPQTLPLLRHSR